MSGRRWSFLQSQFLTNAIAAALQRARVYRLEATESDSAQLGSEMRDALRELAALYETAVSEDEHVRNIRKLADQVSRSCGRFLQDGRLRFGIAQKALNLYLKSLWCAGRIPVPPHCPFDAVVIAKLPTDERVAWTKLQDEGAYMRLVEAARVQAGDESLAEWELRVYGEI